MIRQRKFQQRIRSLVHLSISGLILIAGILLLNSCLLYLKNTRPRNPGYRPDLSVSAAAPGPFRAGFAAVPITPYLPDTWFDNDGNARFEPKNGDTYTDGNGNGRFDPLYLAGFHHNRPAAGVHDDLWARAIVIDDGNTTVGLVVLDSIGIFHGEVMKIRQAVKQAGLGYDHIIITATHNHEAPDLMGLWGGDYFTTGVNQEYLAFVRDRTVTALKEALDNAEPAVPSAAKIPLPGKDLVRDSRKPEVIDGDLYLLSFHNAESGDLIGTMINHGNHPETLGSKNLLITADFCHYLISGIEDGIVYNGVTQEEGIGGTAVFVNRAIGGLMTGLGTEMSDPWTGELYKENSFEKARTHGYRLAAAVNRHYRTGNWEIIPEPSIRLEVMTVEFPVDNIIFHLAGGLGIIDRGFIKLARLKSEVNLMTLGPAWFLTVPGEINPELLIGGIEVPAGADFPDAEPELPPITDMMRGKYNFVLGLANDEIGYIMPKTHWDRKPPYTYGRGSAPYGEIVSLGPDTAPIFHRAVEDLIRRLTA
ncbi:MAG: hypothetical protein ACLFSE_08800, partial [Spirochaetia bacterium]